MNTKPKLEIVIDSPEDKQKPRNEFPKLVAPYFKPELIDMAEPGKLKARIAETLIAKRRKRAVKVDAPKTWIDRVKLFLKKR